MPKLWGGKFPYHVKVQLMIPTVTDVPKMELSEFRINPAMGRFDNCGDDDLAEDVIRAMLG